MEEEWNGRGQEMVEEEGGKLWLVYEINRKIKKYGGKESCWDFNGDRIESVDSVW